MSFPTLHRFVALILVGAGLFASPARAEMPHTVDALVEQLAAVDTFAADFVQERRDAEGNLRRESSGHFVLDRPGRFYWRYEKPYVQELIANEGVLWVYEPDLRQATRSPLEATQGAPIAILMGERPVNEVFRIRALESDGPLSWFALRPRGEAGDFREVLLGVDERGVMEMRFIDQLDQSTRVTFDAREYNQAVDESRFQFDPPEGVDVVEATQPPGVR